MVKIVATSGCVLSCTGTSSDLLLIDSSKVFPFSVEPLRQSFYELEFPVPLLAHTPTSTKLGL